MLTPDQEKLKEAALAATPGKWSRQTGYFVVAETDHGSLVVAQTNNSSWPGRNADFIALANPAAILAILAQLEQVQGWQPIETAPKGPILLLAAEFDRPGDWRIKCGGFWEDAWEVFGASWTPTRWQNLPPPPEAA